jgi:hypothetical protein
MKMAILRAPVSLLAQLQSSGNYKIIPVAPLPQMAAGSIAMAVGAGNITLNAALQKIVMPTGSNGLPLCDCWVSFMPGALQAAVGTAAGSMPTEALELSQECAANFLGPWASVFLALGFTSFVPATNGSLPTMGC